MENIRNILEEKFNKTPEEIEKIMTRVDCEIREGKTVEFVLTDIFGTDMGTILELLGASKDDA